MEGWKQMDKPLRDLIGIIHFTENVSAKIHGVLDEAEIYRIIKEEFAKSKRYTASILLLTDDGSKLRIAETSMSSGELKVGEKTTGFRMKRYKIDLNKSSIYSQVVREGKTVQVNVSDIVGELFPRPLAYRISKTIGYEKKPSILTPLKRHGKIIGAFGMSSSDLAEYLIPSARNLVQHISTALELAYEHAERKRMEEALVQERDLLQALIDNIPDLIYFKDDKNRFIRVNKARAEFSGTSPENMIGKTDFDFFPQEQAKEAFANDNRVMESNRPLADKVEKITDVNGREHWVSVIKIPRHNERGQVIGTMGISRDITERKKAEEELRSSEERLKILFKFAPDGIYLNDLKGTFVDGNKAMEELTDYKGEELVEKNFLKLLPPVQIPKATMLLVKSALGKPTGPAEFILNRKDGSQVTAEISTYPVKIKGKSLALGIARDITERKKAQETLIRSEKLKALGEMAAGVAHDFNNLLAIILGNTQLLERGLKRYKPEEIKERLKIIARTAYEGGETVKRLQYFTQREVSGRDFTKIDLNEIVRSAISSTSPRWKDEAEARGTTIRIKEKLGKLPPLWGSRSGLMEVLTNLIFNALEAMPKGGEITVRTETKENEILLCFTDSGKGIPDRIKEKIFDPFFTTKGPKASGLGLSVSYGIIKRHKGKIKVKSSQKKGTTFTISIPIGLQAPLEKEKLGGAEKIFSRKILVIDDEEGVRDVLGTILHDEGHRVALAKTARKGLDRFKQDDFDLVLTDLGMPEISGWQLAKKIKEIDPGIPVGLITGWAVATPKEKMKKEGVDFILSKPFDLTKVVREVNAALNPRKDSHTPPNQGKAISGLDSDQSRQTLR